MMNLRIVLRSLAAGCAAILLSASVSAGAAVDNKELELKKLAQLEEGAESAEDYGRLARLYELRAEMLEEKVERHERLEKRYAAAPASLLAKRGTAWNTPKRQRQLAELSRRQAQEARAMAATYVAKADSRSVAVD